MTINWNGTSVSNDGNFNNTLIKAGAVTDPTDGKRMDIRVNVNGKPFILTIGNANFQNPPVDGIIVKTYGTSFGHPSTVCQEFDEGTVCDGALATWDAGSSTASYYSDEDILDSYVTITANNATAKTVSGTYDVKMISFFTEDTIHATGTFTNLCYASY